MTSKYDVLLRILLVGGTGVGKTCLLCRYTTDEYIDTHISTLGIDFKTKILLVDNKVIKAQIWDTAGQERFESISRQFYRRAQGIFIVYDITNVTSFNSIDKWVKYIREVTDTDPSLLLIGNKCDKDEQRQVQYEDGERMANKYGMKFFEVSAMDSCNINEAFLAMLREVLSRHADDQEPQLLVEKEKTQSKVKINVKKESKSPCCTIM